MKVICLTWIAVAIVVTVKCKRASFYRALRVTPANHNLYNLSSITGIPNHATCAKQCNTEECLSFSYNEATGSCQTYSRLFVDEKDPDISLTQMFFSKAIGNCSDVDLQSPSGIPRTLREDGRSISLFCDMDTEDGPWTVIQRQTNGNFRRNWNEYKEGFGDLYGNFWIGNENLHLLTKTPKILRVELEGSNGQESTVQYSEFQVANETQKYRLLVHGFSGTIYDALGNHNDFAFTTYDQDNDGFSYNCAKSYNGGWWYSACSFVDLNGQRAWRSIPGTLSKSSMMIK